MTPKTTFTQVVASAEAKKAEQSSTSSPVEGNSKSDNLDLVRTRIEYLLEWAERKSFPASLMTSQNN